MHSEKYFQLYYICTGLLFVYHISIQFSFPFSFFCIQYTKTYLPLCMMPQQRWRNYHTTTAKGFFGSLQVLTQAVNRKVEVVTYCKLVAFILYISPPGVYCKLGNTLHIYLFASSPNLAADLSPPSATNEYCNNSNYMLINLLYSLITLTSSVTVG